MIKYKNVRLIGLTFFILPEIQGKWISDVVLHFSVLLSQQRKKSES